jgi:NAD(P)H-hydrate epimerase
MQRDPASHKGENGKVCVVGGSRHMHGAPIFASLAAQAGGVDLIFLALPARHEDAAKVRLLNAQLHPFAGDELAESDIDPVLQLLATVDCAVIGPGIARDAETLTCLQRVISSASCPLVLDASALQPWTLGALMGKPGKKCVVTPHQGELERMGIDPDEIAAVSEKTSVTILAKCAVDRIASPDGSVIEVNGGNAGLTVGGTGDALAGLVCALLAQRMEPAQACRMASTCIKHAGDALLQTHGYAYTTENVIDAIPGILRTLS